MKKHLLASIALLLVATVTAMAGNVNKVARPDKQYSLKASRGAYPQVQMQKIVATVYDDGYETPNYYILLSDNANVTYDKNTGNISNAAGSYLLTLDLYNYATSPVALPPGIYQPRNDINGYGAMTFDGDYTNMVYYVADDDSYGITIKDPIDVSVDNDGIYTLSVLVRDPDDQSNIIECVYTGRIPMQDVTDKGYVYPQLLEDCNVTLNKGGIAWYQGVTDLSRNGVSILDIYDVEFDNDNGVMKADGWDLRMMIAHKRFVKRGSYTLVPGTYTMSTHLDRDTWYPCREISYNYGGTVITMPFGSFIRKRFNGDYTYAYLKDGTFTIVDDGNGQYHGTIDATTVYGYTVKGTWKGSMRLDESNADVEAVISNLTDDVALDFTPLETGRVYHTGLQGGCRTFIMDLGSPSGKDAGIINGGDLMRFEFLCPPNHSCVKPGIYTVVLDRWNEYELRAGGTYEPYSLNQGHFDSNGGSSGTRYAHFEDGRYCVEDLHGPIYEGTVQVSTTDYINYYLEINLLDDAGFEITGTWDGPIEYNYDAAALEAQLMGINDVAADPNAVKAVVEGKNILVLNAGNAPVQLYNTQGALSLTSTADMAIDASSLPAGIYILKVKNTVIKIALK